jgi:site-specific DNA recombinase
MKGMKTKSGGAWDVKKAYKTITNPIYCGFVRYQGQVNKGIHQPIISEEEFNQVKAKLSARSRNLNIYNRQMKGRAYPICNHSENILSGLAFCGKCGHLLGKATGKRWRYYQCNAKKTHKACGQKNVRADILENLVLKKIDELGHDKAEIERIRAEFFTGNLKKLEKIEAEIHSYRKEITGFNHRIDKTMNWIMETTPAKADSISVLEELNKMKARVKELNDLVNTREMEAASIQVKDIIFSQTEEYLKNFKICYEAKSHEDKRLLLQSVVEKVTVNSFQDIEVRLTLPLFTREGSHHDVLVRPSKHNQNTQHIPIRFRLNLMSGFYEGAFLSKQLFGRFRKACK